MADLSAHEQLNLEITPELYQRIRRLWLKHSIAEDRRDIEGLVATLTEDCVYRVIPTGQRWEGHAGARQFYTDFLAAFPDVNFEVADLVIGPQGVIEVVDMRGTHQGIWHDMQPNGKHVSLRILIHFPWDPVVKKFRGENVYYDSALMRRQLAT
jgi:predicted ester cyclase